MTLRQHEREIARRRRERRLREALAHSVRIRAAALDEIAVALHDDAAAEHVRERRDALAVLMRRLEGLREVIRDEQREVRIMALELRVAVRMTVDRHDAVRVLHDDVAMRVHAERAHKVAVLLRTVEQLCLVDLARDIVPYLIRHLDAHADVDAIVLLLDAETVALIGEPLRSSAARRDDEEVRLDFLAICELEHVVALAVRLDVGDGTLKAELHLLLQVLIRLLEHAQIVLCAEMAHAGAQEMQVVLQGQAANVGVLRREDLRWRAVLHVDLVDVVDELHDLLVRQILVEPAAELRREVVLAVRERTSTTEAAHDAARLAADAALDLARRDRADAVVDVLAALEDDDVESRLLLHQFISCHDAGGATADNRHIVFLHGNAPHMDSSDISTHSTKSVHSKRAQLTLAPPCARPGHHLRSNLMYYTGYTMRLQAFLSIFAKKRTQCLIFIPSIQISIAIPRRLPI